MRFLLLLPTIAFLIACSGMSERFDNNGRFPASTSTPADKNAKPYHVMQDRSSGKGNFLISSVVESNLSAKECEAKAKSLAKKVSYNNYAFIASFVDQNNTVTDVIIADKDGDDPMSKSECADMLVEHKFKGFSCKNMSAYYCGTVAQGAMVLVNGEGELTPVTAQLTDKTVKMVVGNSNGDKKPN